MDRTIAVAEVAQDRLADRRRAGRTADKADRATAEQVLDPATRLLLFDMLGRGRLSTLAGVVSTGKEANVYYATGPLVPHGTMGGGWGGGGGAPEVAAAGAAAAVDGAADGAAAGGSGGGGAGAGGNDLDVGDYVPPPFGGIAVKVFKTAILDFKDRRRYVEGDQRFKSGYSGNSRKMVALWAEKEYANLRRLHRAGVPVPLPLFLKPPVLGMAFVGSPDGWPAPLLKDAVEDMRAGPGGVAAVYRQVVVAMRLMYAAARLVHGDLSEYNLLYDEGVAVVIDVSQSVEADHPNALEFLRADCVNVSSFFRRVWGGEEDEEEASADPAVTGDGAAAAKPGKGAVLSPPALFAFVTRPEADPPTDPDGVGRLAAAMADAAAAAAPNGSSPDADAQEVEERVWARSYMPVTLKEVVDVESDTLLMAGGGETPYAEMMGLAVREAAAAHGGGGRPPRRGGGDSDGGADDGGGGAGGSSGSTTGDDASGGDWDSDADSGAGRGSGGDSDSDGGGGRRERLPVAARTGDAKSLARASMTKAEWKAAVKAEQRERREAKTPKKVKRRKEAVAKRRRHVKVKK